MTNEELKSIIGKQYVIALNAKDSKKAEELEALWNEVDNANFESPASVDTWVKSKGSQFAKFGLDENEDIDKILVKSDKEIYGKIPELQDKEYLDKLDKFSIAKLRSDARKNGFSSVQEYIDAAYKFKADREFMKSFEPDSNASKIDKVREWTVKNFYPNAYEAAKNQPVYGTSGNNKILKSLLADQILNAVAVGTAPIGGLFKQLALGGGTALASEAAGKYFSNKDIDPLQVGIGAGVGAFGGRIAGKSGGDLIKGAAGRLGITPRGNAAGKVIYGVGDALEGAAIDSKEEVAMARKAANKWLGPTNKERVGEEVLNNQKAEYKNILTEVKNSKKYTPAQKKEATRIINQQIEKLDPEKTWIEVRTGDNELRQLKKMLADPEKYSELLTKSGDFTPIKSQKDYWRQSLKNELPTPENVKLHKDILEYSDPKFDAFDSKSALLELEKPVIALESQTGIPFRKAWAEPKFSSTLRTMLQGGSMLGARKSREMDEDDTASIYNAILENKPEDVERYNSGLANNLTPYEKDIIQKFYIRK